MTGPGSYTVSERLQPIKDSRLHLSATRAPRSLALFDDQAIIQPEPVSDPSHKVPPGFLLPSGL